MNHFPPHFHPIVSCPNVFSDHFVIRSQIELHRFRSILFRMHNICQVCVLYVLEFVCARIRFRFQDMNQTLNMLCAHYEYKRPSLGGVALPMDINHLTTSFGSYYSAISEGLCVCVCACGALCVLLCHIESVLTSFAFCMSEINLLRVCIHDFGLFCVVNLR